MTALIDQATTLRSLMQKFVDAGGSTDVKRWAAAAELTAYRVGLLLCHDLRIAGQMISQEQSMLGSTMGPTTSSMQWGSQGRRSTSSLKLAFISSATNDHHAVSLSRKRFSRRTSNRKKGRARD